MTETELKTAVALLADRIDRHEVAAVDGGGVALTVYWRDGGQRLWYALEDVRSWLADKDRNE